MNLPVASNHYVYCLWAVFQALVTTIHLLNEYPLKILFYLTIRVLLIANIDKQSRQLRSYMGIVFIRLFLFKHPRFILNLDDFIKKNVKCLKQ